MCIGSAHLYSQTVEASNVVLTDGRSVKDSMTVFTNRTLAVVPIVGYLRSTGDSCVVYVKDMTSNGSAQINYAQRGLSPAPPVQLTVFCRTDSISILANYDWLQDSIKVIGIAYVR